MRGLAVGLLVTSPGCVFSTVSRSFEVTSLASLEGPEGKTAYSIQSSGMLVAETVLEVKRPYLGVRTSPVTPRIAERAEAPPHRGVHVDWVESNGPAARAGLVSGDVIANFDGTDVLSRDQFISLVRAANPDRPVPILAIRRGEATLVHATLQARTETQSETTRTALPHAREDDALGLEVSTLPSDLAGKVFGAEGTVALVSEVATGGPAYRASLRPGDRVLSVDEKEVRDGASTIERLLAEPLRTAKVVRVRNGGREHVGRLRPRPGSGRGRSFRAPLLMTWESRRDGSDFELGLGLLLDYRKRYLPSSTRDPDYEAEFGALLNLFEIRSDPSGSRVRLLWLITWRTSRS